MLVLILVRPSIYRAFSFNLGLEVEGVGCPAPNIIFLKMFSLVIYFASPHPVLDHSLTPDGIL